jgi:hypothetical protein
VTVARPALVQFSRGLLEKGRTVGSQRKGARQEETMAKGNNSQKKETKKPKKDAASKGSKGTKKK